MTDSGPADIAILGCQTRTLDPTQPAASAIAVRNGWIAAVGDVAEVREWCDASTELVDGQHLYITPGLIDLHQHTVYALPFLRGADLTDVHTPEQLYEAMATEKRRGAGDQWVMGWGLTYEVFGGKPVSSDILEQAVEGAPALIRIFDGHASVATQRAIELAGVDAPLAFPDGSQIVFDERRPTGEIREMAAVSFMTAAAPPVTDADLIATFVETLQKFNAAGLTCVQLMCDRGEPVKLARELESRDLLSLRLIIPTWVRPGDDRERREAQLATRDEHGALWRRGVAKFFADGVIDNGSAWLLEPGVYGDNQQPVWADREEFYGTVALFSRHGFQCATHCVGDGAVADVLDAYRLAGRPDGLLHRIEHLETLPDAVVARCGSEHVALSMQPLTLFAREQDGSDSWSRNLGPERAAMGWRCRDLLDAGALLNLSSDFPVAPYDPRLGMAWARLRREPKTDRDPFEPHQRLTGLETLEAYTAKAALVLGEQACAGRIAPGYRADLTAFAADPVECDPDDLVDLPVLLTVVDGRIVHRGDTS
jgi:predicted amidohydrolase YtcJ